MMRFIDNVVAGLFVVVACAFIRLTPIYWLRDRVNAVVRAQERAAAAQTEIAAYLKRQTGCRP